MRVHLRWLLLSLLVPAWFTVSGCTDAEAQTSAARSGLWSDPDTWANRKVPVAGDKVTIGGKDVAWQEHKAGNYYIDFLQSFGKEAGEYVVGYAVAYVNADADMKVTLALSTNDQGKAWLNGKQVFKFAETRVLDKDTDRVEVTLNKGQNVLMLKVINEVNNWQGCARFLKDGVPVKTLTISSTPQ